MKIFERYKRSWTRKINSNPILRITYGLVKKICLGAVSITLFLMLSVSFWTLLIKHVNSGQKPLRIPHVLFGIYFYYNFDRIFNVLNANASHEHDLLFTVVVTTDMHVGKMSRCTSLSVHLLLLFCREKKPNVSIVPVVWTCWPQRRAFTQNYVFMMYSVACLRRKCWGCPFSSEITFCCLF